MIAATSVSKATIDSNTYSSDHKFIILLQKLWRRLIFLIESDAIFLYKLFKELIWIGASSVDDSIFG